MLKRTDGEFLLTKEIYEFAKVTGECLEKDFYDGDSNLYISFENHLEDSASYWLAAISEGFEDIILGFVNEMTLEEAREKVSQHFKMNNDKPVSNKDDPL